jgi:hypothetical protein
MTILQTAKDLLKKGIALNDPELIQMANQLIEINSIDSVPKKDTKPQTQKKQKVLVESKPAPSRQALVDQFKIEKDSPKEKKSPVTQRERYNSWIDDGTEAKDLLTPEVPITARNRKPPEKVNQKCETCQSNVKVHPTHVREFFICDDCLLNKKKGR